MSALAFAHERSFIGTVKLDLRQKQTLYRELGQFLRSGIPLPQAVEALAQDTGRGPLRRLLRRMTELLLGGETIPAAFAQLQPAVGSMELALVEAASHTGRLEQAFTYLSGYFESLLTLRAGLIRQTAWPLLQLHIGVLLLTGVDQFLRLHEFQPVPYTLRCGATLGVFYAAGACLWLSGMLLVKAGRVNTGVDVLLNAVPLIGRLRRNMALSRFCAAYEMQLEAAINVMDGLRMAADASQSAGIRAAVKRMIPRVREGSGVGPLLAQESVFPRALQRAVRVGEDTGSLDEDLRRWASYYHSAAVSTLELLGTWVPKLGFILIACYLGYEIVRVYSEMMQGLQQTFDL